MYNVCSTPPHIHTHTQFFFRPKGHTSFGYEWRRKKIRVKRNMQLLVQYKWHVRLLQKKMQLMCCFLVCIQLIVHIGGASVRTRTTLPFSLYSLNFPRPCLCACVHVCSTHVCGLHLTIHLFESYLFSLFSSCMYLLHLQFLEFYVKANIFTF